MPLNHGTLPILLSNTKLNVQKFAARLICNNFSHETCYEDLLVAGNLRPIYRQVAERRLIALRNYMGGQRFMPDCVFPLAPDCPRRTNETTRFPVIV
jgi:hypothetical protein